MSCLSFPVWFKFVVPVSGFLAGDGIESEAPRKDQSEFGLLDSQLHPEPSLHELHCRLC